MKAFLYFLYQKFLFLHLNCIFAMFRGEILNEKALFAFCLEQEIANSKIQNKKAERSIPCCTHQRNALLHPFVTIKAWAIELLLSLDGRLAMPLFR